MDGGHGYSSGMRVPRRQRPLPAARPTAVPRRATVALAAVGVALLVTACGGSSGTKTVPFTRVASIKPVSAITVVIKNFAYIPADFTISPGATVTVRNEDEALHTFTADNREFNTGNVAQGRTVTFQAPTERGKHPYHSLLQPYMTGVLTVS